MIDHVVLELVDSKERFGRNCCDHSSPTLSFLIPSDFVPKLRFRLPCHAEFFPSQLDDPLGAAGDLSAFSLSGGEPQIRGFTEGSPRRSQLDSGFVERGTLQFNRLRRAAVIAIFPWNALLDPEPKPEPVKKERRDPLKTARYYQSLLDTAKFESRAALARYLGVSRARVTQVLGRLKSR
jgi:hypothetical protein